MSETKIQAACLCGAVSYTVQGLGTEAGACHCDICRRWGGGPIFALDCADIRFEGEEHIRTYDTTPRAHRGFCSACGTHLFIRVNPNGRFILPAGLFPIENDLRFDHQIFIDKKPDYYTFANETKNLTAEQVFAEHAPPTT